MKKEGLGVIKFENDDEGYKDWLRRNPNGYVINCPYSLNLNNMFLHKADMSYYKWFSYERGYMDLWTIF